MFNNPKKLVTENNLKNDICIDKKSAAVQKNA